MIGIITERLGAAVAAFCSLIFSTAFVMNFWF